MLTELRIVNFAVLEQLSFTVSPGFTVFTGETGVGKSLLIDAIALLVGGRASTDQIRFGADEAHLEAAFCIPPQHPVVDRLRSQDILGSEDTELVIRRIISRSGRNRVYLNGTMVPVHVLEEFGGTLVDIHGQHDQQSLLSSSTQLNVLDSFGDLQGLRTDYQAAFTAWKQACRQRDDLAAHIQRGSEREDILTFQARELDEAALRPGEEEEVEAERRRLSSSQRLGQLTTAAQNLLQADSQSALSNLVGIERTLAELIHLDPEMEEARRLTSEAKVLLKEVATLLRDYAQRLDPDPDRLIGLENRLALIHNLKKKYGGTLETALESQRRIRQELDGIQHADVRLEECTRVMDERRQALDEFARQLSVRRSETAKRMTKAVRQELDALKMGQTRFSIHIRTADGGERYGPDGADQADFLLSSDSGEPLKSLSRVASGGELSRVMLALKTVLAEADRVPVLIFDEIDTGVGGATAAAIGKRLRALGRLHQVLCITHLPQVASQAQHHLLLERATGKTRTVTTVRTLSAVQREAEIARMLGGETITKKVLATAAELIAEAKD
ncbi:MAG: DNA repair protein RecN [Nitrospiraceae bacterium]|nr:DNA repair protein RecN [Nitrospiraceae bacterium]